MIKDCLKHILTQIHGFWRAGTQNWVKQEELIRNEIYYTYRIIFLKQLFFRAKLT